MIGSSGDSTRVHPNPRVAEGNRLGASKETRTRKIPMISSSSDNTRASPNTRVAEGTRLGAPKDTRNGRIRMISCRSGSTRVNRVSIQCSLGTLTPTHLSARHLGLYTILPLPILYDVWHTSGGSGGGVYLPH